MVGQTVDLKFQVRAGPGNYNYTLYVMSDSYLGVDVSYPLRLKVVESTAEEKEQKASKVTKVVQLDSDGEPDGDADDDADDEDEGDDGDYASNETGSEITASDVDDEDEKKDQ